MSWNQSAERKCKDQELVEQAKASCSGHEQLDPNQGQPLHGRVGASAEAVRWAKILALQVAIKEGSYRISAEDVADSLFRFADRHHTSGLQMYSA